MTAALATALHAVLIAQAPGAQPALSAVVPAPPAPAPVRVQAVRCAEKILVDGNLREAVWTSATPISNLVQKDPTEFAAPSERTEVVVAFDDEAIYVGARLHDRTPHTIMAQLARRDRQVTSDSFVVYLDPHRDRRSGVYFGVNVAGTQYDGTLMNDDWSDDSWDGVWQSETARDQQGWTVEMRIPFSQLRFKELARSGWGINFERIIGRNNEHDLLVFTPRRGSGFVSRFPELDPLERIHPPRRIELLPYASFRVDTPGPAGDPFRPGWGGQPRVGADLKVGLGSHLTLAATVYPDFGQVEVDPAVVNLSDNEVFFSERRPFFIEGANLFTGFGSGGARDYWGFNWPGPDLFYSRRIGRPPQGSLPDNDFETVPQATDILGAAKLTGKLGSWNVGTLHALTQREYGRYSAGGATTRIAVEPFSYYGATRVQNELDGGRHGLGLLSTVVARDLADPNLAADLDRNAATLGVDGWTFLDRDKVWAVTGWAAASRVAGTRERMADLQESSVHYFQRPDASHVEVDREATSLTGYAARFTVNKQHGRVLFNAATGAISPGFEVNDLGFGAVSDVLNIHAGTGYQWPDPGRYFRRVLLLVPAIFGSWDFGGTNVGKGVFTRTNLQFPNFWSVDVTTFYSPSGLNNRQTRGGPLMRQPAGVGVAAGLESDNRKRWQIGLRSDVQRSSAEGRNASTVQGYLELRPIDRVSLNLAPSFTRERNGAQYLETLADPGATATYGNRYLFGDLAQTTTSADIRLNCIFTPRLSFELFAQPLLSAVHYRQVRQLAAPRTYAFLPTELSPDAYSFTYASLRASAVLRWEYRPGSTFYLVWNQNQANEEEDNGLYRLPRSYRAWRAARADTVVMAKASYWWSP